MLINVHPLVNELYEYQNARCNDKNLNDRFQFQAPVPNCIHILGVGDLYYAQVDLPKNWCYDITKGGFKFRAEHFFLIEVHVVTDTVFISLRTFHLPVVKSQYFIVSSIVMMVSIYYQSNNYLLACV